MKLTPRAAVIEALETYNPPKIPVGVAAQSLRGVRVPAADRDQLKKLAEAIDALQTSDSPDQELSVRFAMWCLSQWREFTRLNEELAELPEVPFSPPMAAHAQRVTAGQRETKDK